MRYNNVFKLIEGILMNIDVDVYTAKDESKFLITLSRLRPSATSNINMDEYNETPERVQDVKDKQVLEAILGEDRCFCTTTRPTPELLTS